MNPTRKQTSLDSVFGDPVEMLTSNQGRELFQAPAFCTTPAQTSRVSPIQEELLPLQDIPSETNNKSDEEHLPNRGRLNCDQGNLPPQLPPPPPPPEGDPDSNPGSSSNDNRDNKRSGRQPREPRNPRNTRLQSRGTRAPTNERQILTSKPHFNIKLKPENVPEWDGNPDMLGRWLNKLNALSN